MSDSYYDRDYYMSGTKSGYGGRFLPYTDILNFFHSRDEAKKMVRIWHPKKVLELGCATGRLSRALRELGVDAQGIDISVWAIENSDPSIRPFLHVGNIVTDLKNYKDQEFDIVTALDTLEHISKDDLPKVFDEICRIAKQYVLIEVPIVDNGVDKSHATIKHHSWWCMQFTQRKFKLLGSGIMNAPDGLVNYQASFARKV